MKRLALVTLLATGAVALHAETYVDYARVNSAQPQYESISVPRNECSSQVVNEVQPVGGAARNPRVSTVITGASKIAQLQDNLRAGDVIPKLTPEVLARIDEIAVPLAS